MKNDSKIWMVVNSIVSGICIGAVLSLPMVILAVEFDLSVCLCALIPTVFFGTIIPVSTICLCLTENMFIA